MNEVNKIQLYKLTAPTILNADLKLTMLRSVILQIQQQPVI